MESETQITVTETRPDVIEKMSRWALMGGVIHDENIRLAQLAEKAVLGLIYKPTPEQLLDAETAIADASKQIKAISEDRIKITSKFDAVRDALSVYEKNGTELINSAKKDLLEAKQKQASIDAEKKAKEDEIRRIHEAITKRISEVDAGYKSMIAIKITDIYERALNGECPTENTTNFLDNERKLFALAVSFETKRPTISPTYASAEEVTKIWDECSVNIKPSDFYTQLFETDLATKFEFYGIALKHKESSIAHAKQKQAEDLAAIAKEKASADAGAKLAAMANDYKVDEPKTAKDLKKTYEVKMDDTELTALTIIAAFCGNIEICRGGVRVTSWQNLTVKQMSAALAWAKNRDDKFNVTGINFVAVDKL